MQKTSQAFICEADFYQPVMGATFYFPISRLESANEVTPPPPKIASHFLFRNAASDPAKGEKLVKRERC